LLVLKFARISPELSKLRLVVQVSRLIAKEALMATGNSTSKRGFASMDEERQREIASKGGKSVPAEKRSFSQDRELASEAGRKGGQASGGSRSSQD
jgi:general stress protein YciG